MKKLLLILFLLPYLTQAQEKLQFDTNNEVVEFDISEKEFLVKFDKKDFSFIKEKSKLGYKPLLNDYVLISTPNIKGTLTQRKTQIQEIYEDKLIGIEPILFTEDGAKTACISELILKVKDKKQIPVLLHGYSYGITENEYAENKFLITFNGVDTPELLNLSNRLRKHQEVELVQPNFIHFIELLTNDPLLNQQWAINNTGENSSHPNSHVQGVVDADMDVDEAWAYSTGQGIKVAVFDTGIDLHHPDLVQNILTGTDVTGNGTGGEPIIGEKDTDGYLIDYHGTAVAGVIAATANNNIGIAGVAYDVELLSVRFLGRGSVTTSVRIDNAVNWALANGADIINNSWKTSFNDPAIATTMTNAIENGRNGKGCVVLFGTGNEDVNGIVYPARLDNVIAVGASTRCDERAGVNACDGSSAWGSNYGDELDVVAPGVYLMTTDISGVAGGRPDDYTPFSRTSSACPNAAGVVALILSINPDLTSSEARKILERSTDKITGGTNNYVYNETQPNSQNYHPNGTWNNEVGYGRVNALNAVESMYEIGGPSVTCGDTETYDFFAMPDNVPYSWNVSSGLTVNANSDNQSITVHSTNSLRGAAFVEVDYGGETLRKDIWWGEPQVELKLDPVGGNYVWLELVGANGSDISKQGITSITWTEVPGTNNGGCFASIGASSGTNGGADFYGLVHGNCLNWRVSIDITVTNKCGSITMRSTITPPPPVFDPCNRFAVNKTGKNTYSVFRIIDPCRKSSKVEKVKESDITRASLFDFQGFELRTFSGNTFNVEGIKTGVYIFRVEIDGELVTQKIIIE